MRGVLIVDDEALLRALICETLSVIPDIAFFEAEDGMAALEQARKYLPKLVICDIRLPKLYGFEVCRILKNDPALADVAVILLTAAVDASDAALAKVVRADGFLRKPFEEAELLELVLGILQSKV